MVELTRDLLRSRAEHNEKMLSNLEEVSLHQQNIKKIENLDVYCRHLKILYFQNNLIEKMEGLNKLVELEYLNLAVNSIKKIEGVKRCESLNKLDFTLNFIDLENLRESYENLEWNCALTDLYMTGNPCTDWAGYREYTIAKVETLMQLDGTEITKSERLAAKQKLEKLEYELDILAEQNVIKKENEKKEGIHNENAWTPENRWQDYLDEEARKKEADDKAKDSSMFKEYHELVDTMKQKAPERTREDGTVIQCNHAKLDFDFKDSEDKTSLIFRLAVPRFMQTNDLNVEVHPNYVRAMIKDKIVQLCWPDDVLCDKANIQRSTTTGELVITAPKSNIDNIVAKKLRIARTKETLDKKKQLDDLKEAQAEAKRAELEKLERAAEESFSKNREFLEIGGEKKPIQKENEPDNREKFVPDFDEDEVPDLE